MDKSLLELLVDYVQSNHIVESELAAIERILQLLETKPDCFGRQPGGHITASAWIVNPENNAALLTHHKKLNMWLQLGGHCEDSPDVQSTALREAQEESGLSEFDFIIPGIFDIDIHAIPNACEYHYDVRFLLRAKSSDFVISDESHNLAWVLFDEIPNYTQEESVLRMNQKYILNFSQ